MPLIARVQAHLVGRQLTLCERLLVAREFRLGVSSSGQWRVLDSEHLLLTISSLPRPHEILGEVHGRTKGVA